MRIAAKPLAVILAAAALLLLVATAAAQATRIPVAGDLISATGLPFVHPEDIHPPSGSTHDNLVEYIDSGDGSQAASASQGPELLMFWGASSAVDYATISTAVAKVISLLNPHLYGGGYHKATATESYFVNTVGQRSSGAVSSNIGMEHIWPENGTAPYIWALAPSGSGQLDRVHFRYLSTEMTNSTVSVGFLRLNGNLYDLKYEQVALARPTTFGNMIYRYTYPAVLANPN